MSSEEETAELAGSVNGDGMELLAVIIKSNVDAAARTTDMLLQGEREQALRFAKALLVLADAVEDARVVDRFLLSTLDGLHASIMGAEAYVRGTPEK